MSEYTIMTMNMQTDNPLHPFKTRAPLLQNIITTYSPDLIGTQEITKTMKPFLKDLDKTYVFSGNTRHSWAADEHNAIFYKRSRFTFLDGGTLWLSRTPAQTGSKFFASQFPRIVTYVVLRDKENETVFTFFNTHLDHNFRFVRRKQAEVLVQLMHQYAKGSFLILTGDFNDISASSPLQTISRMPLTDTAGNLDSSMRDPAVSKRYHNKAIDHIFISSSLSVLSIEKINDFSQGIAPSDHYPVLLKCAYEKA